MTQFSKPTTKAMVAFLAREAGRVTGLSIEDDGVFIYTNSAEWCDDSGAGTFRADSETAAIAKFKERVRKAPAAVVEAPADGPKQYRLGSVPMCSAPGLVRWAMNGYAFPKDRAQVVRVIAEGWNIPAPAADALLSKAVPYTVEGETVIFTFPPAMMAQQAQQQQGRATIDAMGWGNLVKAPKAPKASRLFAKWDGRRTPNCTGQGRHKFSAHIAMIDGDKVYTANVYQDSSDHCRENGLSCALYLNGRALPEGHKQEVRLAAIDVYTAAFLTDEHKAAAKVALYDKQVSGLDWPNLDSVASGKNYEMNTPGHIAAAQRRIDALKAVPPLASATAPAAPASGPVGRFSGLPLHRGTEAPAAAVEAPSAEELATALRAIVAAWDMPHSGDYLTMAARLRGPVETARKLL